MNRLRAFTDTLAELAAVYIAFLTLSALLFMWLEGHGFLDSLYWAGTTATSTGYGDISPRTVPGRILAVVLMHLSVFGIAPLIVVRLVDRLNENRNEFTHEEQLRILEGIARIEEALNCAEARKAQDRPEGK